MKEYLDLDKVYKKKQRAQNPLNLKMYQSNDYIEKSNPHRQREELGRKDMHQSIDQRWA